MCVTRVNLPTVVSFLMLYSLRCGCVTILMWTTVRSLFCLFFFMVGIVEVFLLRASPFGANLFANTKELPGDDLLFFILYAYVFIIITESFLLVHMIHFAVGLYNDSSPLLGLYLIIRFFTLLFEIVFLTMLCLSHQVLIGWYLGFLTFIVLEFYSFIVVYSYYVDLKEEEYKAKGETC